MYINNTTCYRPEILKNRKTKNIQNLKTRVSGHYFTQHKLNGLDHGKNATSNAFIAAKRKREEAIASGGQEINPKADVNSFEEQHHHLLSCLESATVSFN